MKLDMKKIFTLTVSAAFAFILSACNMDAFSNDGSSASARREKGYKPKPRPAVSNGLYKHAEGYEMGPWQCWDNDGAVATTEDGADGGMRITQALRPCGGTYWGVNLAAGTNSGANKDLDGKGYTKIVMKIRGTTPANTIYFFGNNETEGIGDWDGVSQDGNGKVWYRLDHYTSEYNETTWTEITVPVTYGEVTSTMSSCLTIGGDGGWVEVKEIDWQDDEGNFVVPAYAGT
ncbi:MAG: hypothetical protein J6O39_06390 [Treponema sp.]|nr:hypothetical protein [Treponema sp.]